ncbi:LOW QUALITY PROTEIN: E3 ubiquitin-protein ligase TM129-like [Gigantopelta aegis]|uniref:LOW QUALITY PROTEIN: E3 ubiquitin-protein ligase TM129-like n=1 Tax=Gigantopelta aegis TaxID=1735272 RepID=UPI001B887F34|nr:LOW QUALITY PROTEIN: E3 ubiquitin-protein ligase TM129-like [Gigantopelta aegis]
MHSFFSRSEGTVYALFTLFYIFFSACLVAPPTEFISAGLTVQNIFSSFLGSEQMHFVYYHIRRTTATMIVHSLLPLGYYIGLGLFAPELQLFFPWSTHTVWNIFLAISVLLPVLFSLLALYWFKDKWNNHPIACQLSYLTNDPSSSWRSVASSIDIEFRRVDKFTTGHHGRRLIVTDSWIMKTSAYFVNIAHQQDIHLTLSGSEEHEISYENLTPAQFLNIHVGVVNRKIKSFDVRLNATELGDLKEKLQSPVRNARNIVIKQSLSDQFLEAFREQVNMNPPFTPPPSMEVENCIGCMQKMANVKLHKLCDNMDSGDCVPCYCRPMWCLECMGKWFASRQDQHQPEGWLSSKSPCPTCRAKFCVLDVCHIKE